MYFAMLGRTCVLLLCGGDKGRQSSDIKRAIEYLEDFKDKDTKPMKDKTSVSHDESMARELRENPDFAAEYLRAAMEDEAEPRVLLVALRRVAEAPGLAKVAIWPASISPTARNVSCARFVRPFSPDANTVSRFPGEESDHRARSRPAAEAVTDSRNADQTQILLRLVRRWCSLFRSCCTRRPTCR